MLRHPCLYNYSDFLLLAMCILETVSECDCSLSHILFLLFTAYYSVSVASIHAQPSLLIDGHVPLLSLYLTKCTKYGC